MKREDLKKLELSDEAIEAVMKLYGESMAAAKDAQKAAQAEADALKSQLAEANAQIEKFAELDIDSVKAEAADWKARAEQAEKDYAAKLAAMKFDNDLQKAMDSAGVLYPNEVLARLKMDDLRDDKGAFISERFDAQVKNIKSEAEDLFKNDKPIPKFAESVKNGVGNKPETIEEAIAQRLKGK